MAMGDIDNPPQLTPFLKQLASTGTLSTAIYI